MHTNRLSVIHTYILNRLALGNKQKQKQLGKTIKTITLLLLRCGTTWVNEHIHTCNHTNWVHTAYSKTQCVGRRNVRACAHSLCGIGLPGQQLESGRAKENTKSPNSSQLEQLPVAELQINKARPATGLEDNINYFLWRNARAMRSI